CFAPNELANKVRSKSPMRGSSHRAFTLTGEASLRKRRASSAHQPGDHRDREQHNRHEEHDLRRFDGNAGDHSEAKQRRDQRNNQKGDSPTQTGNLLTSNLGTRTGCWATSSVPIWFPSGASPAECGTGLMLRKFIPLGG